jgi:glutathione-regulated potassium-efflux system ancillary protein KefG
MVPSVDTGDLIDAHEVAELLGLSHRNSVSLYQRRYPDMPRPVVERGGGRTKLWLRSEIERWRNERQPSSTDGS